MTVLVIDAKGGGIGKQLTAAIKQRLPGVSVIAIGTNSTAAAAMLRAGADDAATGENAVVVGCRTADIIVGPIGIAIADSMLGEVTPRMSLAVAQSRATKVLIPVSHCGNVVVGVSNYNTTQLIQEAIEAIETIIHGGKS